MQALHRLALEPVAETTADGSSYGFRPSRSTADVMEKVHTFLAWKRSAEWVLEADIKGCFDHISHEWLMRNVPVDKRLLSQWLKSGYMEHGNLFPTDSGTPQGGIISPTLANMVLDGLEKLIQSVIPATTRRGKAAKVNFVRYADDFIVTGASKEILEAEIKPAIETFLAERGLWLSPEKTVVTHINDGFDFLGFNVRKYDGTLLIKPSKAGVKRLLGKVREIVRPQGREAGRSHRHPQPDHSGLGELLPAQGVKGNLRQGGSRHLASALEMGETAASEEGAPVDQGQVLCDAGDAELGVCRQIRTFRCVVATRESQRHTDRQARCHQGGSQSV
jgi:group II intron reverse transcriptase/maturase